MVQIFLSSTSLDLKEHRATVIKQLQEANHLPIAMETFGSKAGDAQTVSLEEVEKADLFIGIYAHRYGYIVNGRSVTEQEYYKAKEEDIPRLIFIVEDGYHHERIEEHRDTDPKQVMLLSIFKETLLQENVRDVFTTPQDLAHKVLLAIQNWLADQLDKKDENPSNQPQINITNNNSDTSGSVYGNVVSGDLNFSPQKSSKKKKKR